MVPLVVGFGLVALVMTVAGLASGIIERAPLSFPMIFLGLGLALGPGGTGLIDIELHTPLLEIVAVVSLALVLFLDAVNMKLDEIRSSWQVPFLTLGPGALLTIILGALAAYLIIGTTPIESLLLGAILASTDPVVLRDILRDPRIPRPVRQALGIESGMNDIVVLPIVLVLIAVLNAQVGGVLDWALFLGKLLVLSPLVGLLIGGGGAWLMGTADARFGIRREYQAFYGIGLVLAAYAAGQMVQGDGFLASFFAGLAVTLFNVSLCDCFVEFGEVISEMAMLTAFIMFGAVLSTQLSTISLWPALLLAVVLIGVVRPVAFGFILRKARMSNAARGFISWFGPRGLNSLLLALLAVQQGVPNAETLLAISGVVVLVSVVVHGATATPLAKAYGRRVAVETLDEERTSEVSGLFEDDPNEVVRIGPAALAEQLAGPHPPVVLDVRSRGQYLLDDYEIPGSVRVLPDQIDSWQQAADKARPVVAYCTCPHEASSGRVARELRRHGFVASALEGGYAAWKALYPVVPKGSSPTPTQPAPTLSSEQSVTTG